MYTNYRKRLFCEQDEEENIIFELCCKNAKAIISKFMFYFDLWSYFLEKKFLQLYCWNRKTKQ